MQIAAELAVPLALILSLPASAQEPGESSEASALDTASFEAQKRLRQTFTNLQFEDFGPAPVKGPVYQANAGGRIIYFAPESEHLLFAAVYDKNGVNLTALAQDAASRRHLGSIPLEEGLVIGPPGAPEVVEFTDPDCPYCQALERFWSAKAIEGRPIRRRVYFVTGMHPQAAALAEHIMCSPDQEAAFKAVYSGSRPEALRTCQAGAEKVTRDMKAARDVGVSGTPTLVVDGRLVSGFQQGELETFLNARYGGDQKSR